MNGKFILIGMMILCPTVGCIYLYVKNRKLKKAFDSTTAVAEVQNEQLNDYIHRYEFLKEQFEKESKKEEK